MRVVRQFISLISIELNILRDDLSTFVILGHGFKKAGSVLYIYAPGTRTFKSDYIIRYLHTWVVLRLCIVFKIGESPRFCSKYSHWYDLLLIWGGTKVSSIAIELLLQDEQHKVCGFF